MRIQQRSKHNQQLDAVTSTVIPPIAGRIVARIGAAAALAFSVASCVNGVDDDLGQVMSAGEIPADAEAMTAQCAKGATTNGIDVSYYQGSIDWHQVAAHGVKFAIMRVSDGTDYPDSRFETNWQGAKHAGIMRGAYQFFEAGEDPIAQADLLLAHMGPLSPGDLPPMLDIEQGGNDGESAHVIAQRARAWVNRIEQKLHVKPLIYTGPYEWVDSVGSADFNDLPLVVAHYGTQCPYVPPTWTRWTMHQYTSTGHVAGIAGNVDLDHFNGTLAELHALGFENGEPHACVTHHYDGAYCDDDGKAGEASHDALKNVLEVDFNCGTIAGSPAFCGNKNATRAQAAFVIGKAFDVPTKNKPDAFTDDEHNADEKYLDALHAYDVVIGFRDGRSLDARPTDPISRNTLAGWLDRTFNLPAAHKDYFDDDNGSPEEALHNRVAAAGLMTGGEQNGKRVFNGGDDADRSTLAIVAVRAHNKHLKPVWQN